MSAPQKRDSLFERVYDLSRWLDAQDDRNSDAVALANAVRLIVGVPDRFPDRHVPGNPFIARLPGDGRPWIGWKEWNL